MRHLYRASTTCNSMGTLPPCSSPGTSPIPSGAAVMSNLTDRAESRIGFSGLCSLSLAPLLVSILCYALAPSGLPWPRRRQRRINASAHIASRTPPPATPSAMAATGIFTFSRQHIDIGVAHLPTGAFSAPPNTNTSYDDDDPDPLVATAQNGDLGSGTSAAPDASCE
ncbi:hypothetical protein MGG_00989 [Pyricularia oryzae 70-15]|uniref:Uncharacterized protein n=1 Tax=Pyricularia oryzae (strain 70-15 / ATCC MYA-4617 / FGSC 8958) TaxID=242507 RepID=G4ND34_PYRO7|nr:uncharacterized protein MGG_00989 [Pyricularia oryzae 70-15]EHA48376.1 hypothetical protein MGG_00989 [Pyricularia oryzae 70-15]